MPGKQKETKPYSESKDHVPDPTAISGTLDTSGTAGGGMEHLENTTNVFNADLIQAAEAEAVGHGIETTDDPDVDLSGNNPVHRDEDLATGTADTTEGGAKTPQHSTKSPAKKAAPRARVRSKAPAKKAATKKAAAKKTTAKKSAAKSNSSRTPAAKKAGVGPIQSTKDPAASDETKPKRGRVGAHVEGH